MGWSSGLSSKSPKSSLMLHLETVPSQATVHPGVDPTMVVLWHHLMAQEQQGGGTE